MTEPTHYYLPGSGGSVTGPHIKSADFFIEQGGLRNEWGISWKPICCPNVGIEDARRMARKIEREAGNTQYPESQDFTAEKWIKDYG